MENQVTVYNTIGTIDLDKAVELMERDLELNFEFNIEFQFRVIQSHKRTSIVFKLPNNPSVYIGNRLDINKHVEFDKQFIEAQVTPLLNLKTSIQDILRDIQTLLIHKMYNELLAEGKIEEMSILVGNYQTGFKED